MTTKRETTTRWKLGTIRAPHDKPIVRVLPLLFLVVQSLASSPAIAAGAYGPAYDSAMRRLDYAEAVRIIDDFLSDGNPKHQWQRDIAHIELAETYRKWGDNKKAAEELQNFLKHPPLDDKPTLALYYSLGATEAFAQDDYQLTISLSKQSLEALAGETDPPKPFCNAHWLAAQSHLNLRQYKLAQPSLELSLAGRCIEQNPVNKIEKIQGLLKVYVELGNADAFDKLVSNARVIDYLSATEKTLLNNFIARLELQLAIRTSDKSRYTSALKIISNSDDENQKQKNLRDTLSERLYGSAQFGDVLGEFSLATPELLKEKNGANDLDLNVGLAAAYYFGRLADGIPKSLADYLRQQLQRLSNSTKLNAPEKPFLDQALAQLGETPCTAQLSNLNNIDIDINQTLPQDFQDVLVNRRILALRECGFLNEALDLAMKAHKRMLDNGTRSGITAATSFNNLGQIYLDLALPVNAMHLFLQGLASISDDKGKPSIEEPTILQGLANAFAQMNLEENSLQVERRIADYNKLLFGPNELADTLIEAKNLVLQRDCKGAFELLDRHLGVLTTSTTPDKSFFDIYATHAAKCHYWTRTKNALVKLGQFISPQDGSYYVSYLGLTLQYYRASGNPHRAKSVISQMLDYSKTHGKDVEQLRCLVLIGASRVESDLIELDEAVQRASEALQCYVNLGETQTPNYLSAVHTFYDALVDLGLREIADDILFQNYELTKSILDSANLRGWNKDVPAQLYVEMLGRLHEKAKSEKTDSSYLSMVLLDHLRKNTDEGTWRFEGAAEQSANNLLVDIAIDQGDIDWALGYIELLLSINSYREDGLTVFSNDDLARASRLYELLGNRPAAILFLKEIISNRERQRARIFSPEAPWDTSQLATAQRRFISSFGDVYRNLIELLVMEGRFQESEDFLRLLKKQEYFEYSSRSGDYSTKSKTFLSGNEIAASKILNDGGEAMVRRSVEALQAGPISPEITEANLNNQSNSNFKVALKGAIVAIVSSRDGLLATVKTSTVTRTYALKIGPKELVKEIWKIRSTLINPRATNNERGSISGFISEIFSPLVGQIRKVGLIVDGPFRYLPTAAFSIRGKAIIDLFDIVHVVGSIDADRMLASPNKSVMFGNSKGFYELSALPNVRTEIDGIVRTEVQAGYEARAFVDSEFSKEKFSNALYLPFSHLHLASHFSLAPGVDSETFVLTGAGEKLTLEEIRGSKVVLRGQLVTLSACSTAMDAKTSDGREVEGLAHTFIAKGVQQVVASLWRVQDQSTSLLMQRFYGELLADKQRDVARALGKAQRWLRSRPGFSHPYFWAGFIALSASPPSP